MPDNLFTSVSAFDGYRPQVSAREQDSAFD
jgi:hypothetical protein